MIGRAAMAVVLLLAMVCPSGADETGDLIIARQCFPAALLLARDTAGGHDAALARFCGLVTGSCDGTDRPMAVPAEKMQAGAAWQACLRRTGDVVGRLTTLPPADTCEERADLAATAGKAAERARSLYQPIGRTASRLEIARTELAARQPALPDDPCPPAAPPGEPLGLSAATGTPEERLVAALLQTEVMGDPEPLERFEQAADAAGAADLAAIAASRRAQWLQQHGGGEAALTAADAAALRAATADVPQAEESALTTRAIMLDALGADGEATADAFAAALRTLDRRRAELLTFDWIRQGSPYRLRVEPLVERYVALQIDRAELLPETARSAIYRDVLRVAEQARAAELSDYFRDDCVADLQDRTRSIGDIDPHAAALVTIVQGASAELFLMLPDGVIRHHRASLPPRAELEAYPGRLIDPIEPEAWKAQSRTLYDLLIRPFAADLIGMRTLVFVPDGPLRHVLPATLLDGDTLLIERMAVALNPGLDFVDVGPPRRGVGEWLLGATSRACPPAWDALEGTKAEVASIAALRPPSDTVTLLNGEFGRANLFDDLATRPFSVLHFATHAEFAPEASDSKVLLGTCGELDLDGLEQLIKQARYRDRPVDLLVLSACQTALGDDRAALGLAGLAVKSGARSAIGSMWQVDDAAAARLMVLFHGELARGGLGTAEALRQAQLTLAAEPGMRAPRYWAAFQLVGAWQ